MESSQTNNLYEGKSINDIKCTRKVYKNLV